MSSATNDIISAVCAACGKSGDNLKACMACHLVKYCNRECQISHRPKHKKECRQRAAELRCAGDDNTSMSNFNEISEGISDVSISDSIPGSASAAADKKKTSTSYEQNNYEDINISKVAISDEELFRDPPKKEECQICYLPMPFSNGVCGINTAYMTCCGKVFCTGCVLVESQEMDKGNIKRLCSFCREPIRVSNKVHKPKDSKKAFELYIQAAQLGSPDGYSSVATAYQFGFGVGKDKEKSMHYLKLAAMAGHETARCNLGSAESRQGNNIRAMKHFMIAARAGFEESLKVVGQGYKAGLVTKEDYASTLRAIKCL